MPMNYKERLQHIDAKRGQVEARYERKVERARKDACFMIGEMVLDGLLKSEPNGINWKNLAKACEQDKWLHKFFDRDIFWSQAQANHFDGMPGQALKEYRDKTAK